ncbi:SDR family oxidoreductase [Streptomyces sp. NPDC058686]|uniref:SDR family oxidoreductase n=1 Tax=Streptomyces sp. NPDC058686 TaxID=3346599 RepID=UPI00366716F2
MNATPATAPTTRKKIAVAGATGRLGRHVVDVLEEQGHDVVAISRAQGVDIVTGDGLAEALHGVEVVIDSAGTPSPDQQVATDFFTSAARNLRAAGEKAGVARIAAVSIIGIEASVVGYNAAKPAHEHALLEGALPVRILRAAQFHEFVPQLLAWGTQGDTGCVPRMGTQLVAARSVAEALVGLALEEGSGTATAPFPEIAGPREESLVGAATAYAAVHGPATVQGVSDPADPERDLFENGGLLPGPHATLAGPAFEEWAEGVN